MCGITGYLSSAHAASSDSAWKRTVLSRMTATLAARGPDGAGEVLMPPVGFGHRRLSIIDLTDAGAQPMQLALDGPLITYNGEVYNFLELRRELLAHGYQFRGHSDTEVILHSYARWGLEGLKRLEGIFALALWDPRYERLVLMRDRLGVKPLFYAESDLGLAFGSEIKAVLAAGGVDTRLDDQAFAEYLWYGNTFEERTFYAGVRQLLPGHWLIAEGGRQRVEAWWGIEAWLKNLPVANAIETVVPRIRDAIDTAVRRQLVADVSVGLFLSGGLDSSAIAASARMQGEPLTSFAAGFDFDRGINELPKAALVASHLGLNHRELHISGEALGATLETLTRAHDEPFADSANVPLYLMARSLPREIKVVLQGDGGDELFAGYRRYAILQNAQWWRLWPRALSPIARRLGSYGRRFARLTDSVGAADPALRMAYLMTVETPQDPPEDLLLPDRRRELANSTDPFLVYRRAARRFGHHDPVQQMLLTDLTVQLPSQFLTKVDRATMAAGIEARVPLLDERVAELVVGMPSSWKVRGMEKKVLLRESQRGRLPDGILDGPKTGFGVPFQHWLRTSLYAYARERLLDRQFLDRFQISEERLERMLERHRTGRRDHGFTLWKVLQLAIWAQRGL